MWEGILGRETSGIGRSIYKFAVSGFGSGTGESNFELYSERRTAKQKISQLCGIPHAACSYYCLAQRWWSFASYCGAWT
jgi:hypothetical protein